MLPVAFELDWAAIAILNQNAASGRAAAAGGGIINGTAWSEEFRLDQQGNGLLHWRPMAARQHRAGHCESSGLQEAATAPAAGQLLRRLREFLLEFPQERVIVVFQGAAFLRAAFLQRFPVLFLPSHSLSSQQASLPSVSSRPLQ